MGAGGLWRLRPLCRSFDAGWQGCPEGRRGGRSECGGAGSLSPSQPSEALRCRASQGRCLHPLRRQRKGAGRGSRLRHEGGRRGCVSGSRAPCRSYWRRRRRGLPLCRYDPGCGRRGYRLRGDTFRKDCREACRPGRMRGSQEGGHEGRFQGPEKVFWPRRSGKAVARRRFGRK